MTEIWLASMPGMDRTAMGGRREVAPLDIIRASPARQFEVTLFRHERPL